MNQLSPAPTWQRLGSWAGGPVLDIGLSPTFAVDGMALAATAAGLYRTDDGGDSWQRTAAELADPSFLAVAFAPANRPGQVCAYAASESGRLYTSLDSGLTWQEVSAWSGLGQATQLLLSPGFDQDRTLFVATGTGVFRTQDGGLHWESATFGLHDLEVLCLALAPDFVSSEVIWCGTAAGGLYRSRNAARSWRDSGQGLPDDAVTA